MTNLLPKLYPLILLILGLLFLVPFLGYAPLFDGSELRHAEAAREMLVTNTFSYAQLDFRPDYATPPLMPWLQALSMRIFGVADNAELAARLPSALIGIITILTLFFIGRKKHDARFGFLWALSYLGSVTPLVLAKSALPATTGYFFVFLGALFFVKAVSGQSTRDGKNLIWSGLFFGSGLLTMDGLIPGFLFIALLLTKYWQGVDHPRSTKIRTSSLVLGIPILCCLIRIVLIPGADWRKTMFPVNSASDPFAVIYFLMLGLMGILTAITLGSRYWSAEQVSTPSGSAVTFQAWMGNVARSSVVLFFYSPSGALLTWFSLSYLATYHLYQVWRGERTWDRLNTYLLIIDGLVVGLIMIVVPLTGMNPNWLAQRTSDPYWVGITEAPVSWAGWEWLIGVALIILTTLFAWLMRRHVFQSMVGLYVATAVCTLTYMAVIVPKIEQYTQQPLIDFCEAKWKQPVYVQPTFTSYAQLFYTRKQPPVKAESRRLSWLTNGPVDKQTFIITTATNAALYRYNPNLELINEEYGYVFFKRKQYR